VRLVRSPANKGFADTRAAAALAANPHMKFSEGGFNKVRRRPCMRP